MIKIGLIGCGGRGSGAAANAMNAGKDVRLVAMADIFDDRLQGARRRLKKLYAEQVAVNDEHCFLGFDAYEKLVHSGVDVVLCAAASHFHPLHLTAAVAAGKHVFCEKPHGLDVPGLKMAMAAAEEARKKRLCLVSGLCWRYDPGVREAMHRAARRRDRRDRGHPGDVRRHSLRAPRAQAPIGAKWNTRCRTGTTSTGSPAIRRPSNWCIASTRRPGRWATSRPLKAWGLGGRQVCVEPKYGDQFDHHAVVFEYASGVRVFGFCRDMPGCYNETSDVILGTKGRAILPSRPRIEGAESLALRRT